MEEEQREDGSSRYHHRQDAGNYPREEYRPQHQDHQKQQHQQQLSHFDPPPPVPPSHFDGQQHQRDGPGPEALSHYGRDLPPVPEEDESRMPPHDVARASVRSPSSVSRIPPSPRDERAPAVQRSHSAGGPLPTPSYRTTAGTPLKRSFWHHSRPVGPGDEFESSLPQEFMPPKRSKVTPPGSSSRGPRDYVVTARTGSSENLFDSRGANNTSSSSNNSTTTMMGPGLSPSTMQSPTNNGWYGSRAMSWEAREDYYRRDPRSAPSWSSRSPPGRDAPSTGSASHWSEAPYMPSPRSRYEG